MVQITNITGLLGFAPLRCFGEKVNQKIFSLSWWAFFLHGVDLPWDRIRKKSPTKTHPRLVKHHDYRRKNVTWLLNTIGTPKPMEKLQGFRTTNWFQSPAKSKSKLISPINPSKIEWDLTNGPLSKLLELLDTQV